MKRALGIFLMALGLWATSRAIISVKTKDGKLLPLYSGYYALVIGVSDYHYLPNLPNAVQDAEKLSRVLKNLHFKVTLLKNPTRRRLQRALYKFAEGEAGKDPNAAVLIYFAGHGHTLPSKAGKPLGFILPADCPSPNQDPIGFKEKAFSMGELRELLLTMKAKHIMAIFDSCFSGSIWYSVRAVPVAITEMTKEPIVEYITAGKANEQVPDQSEFTRALINALSKGYADSNRDGYITGQELGTYLSQTVINATDAKQHPQFGRDRQLADSPGDFVFVLKPQTSAYSPQPSAPPPSTTFNLEDLKQKAKIRARWQEYLNRMTQAYEETRSLEKNTQLQPSEKAQAWERFLTAFSSDDPFTDKDERMRAYAKERLKYWKTRPSQSVSEAPRKKYAVIIVQEASIRSLPSSEGEILFVASKGEKLEILEDLGTWLKVRREDGVVGYVWSKLVGIEIE